MSQLKEYYMHVSEAVLSVRLSKNTIAAVDNALCKLSKYAVYLSINYCIGQSVALQQFFINLMHHTFIENHTSPSGCIGNFPLMTVV